MTLRGEYTTVADLRATYLKSNQVTDDVLLLDMIRAVSRDIDRLSVKRFYPRIETRYLDPPFLSAQALVDGDARGYPLPRYRELALDVGEDGWLLAVTTLANGDGTSIASSKYNLVPKNSTPYYAIKLKQAADVSWEPDSDGNYEQVIALTGVWGYHNDYAHAWEDTLGTVQNATEITAGGTSLLVQTGKVKAGYLLKIGTEYLYVSALTVAATDTATVVRGVNGSTAAAHANGTAISRWAVSAELELLCRQAAAATYKLRDNPSGETVSIDGNSFHTPRDVRPWLQKQLDALGLVSRI